MNRSSHRPVFTRVEVITVIVLIVIVVSLTVALNGPTFRIRGVSQVKAEIMMLSQACENYKTDNGHYPQDTSAGTSVTSSLDPKTSFSPSNYIRSCSFLYAQLSGDTNANGVVDRGEKGNVNYAPDFFKTAHLAGGGATGQPVYIIDPYGNSYGYSTAGLLLQQEWKAKLETDPSAAKPTANSLGTQGYNSSFDLWSTSGTKGGGPNDPARWVKNW